MIRKLAVVGATGAVGQIVLDEIQKQKLEFGELQLLASARSAGKKVAFAGQELVVQELNPGAFEGVDLVIASTPDEVAAEFAPWAVDAGAVVVDESAFFRMAPNVPLVIPEVNPQAALEHQGIIASPNCSTTQMVVALKPLYDAAGLEQVIVSTYQAVSGGGLAAQEELVQNTKSSLAGRPSSRQVFPHEIAFNLIPQIGSHREQGFTSEEIKMVQETHKILGDDSISINPTCIRVPVLVGHSESIFCRTREPLEVESIRELFAQAPGVTLMDDLDNKSYPMPRDCEAKPDVFVGRIRKDLNDPCGISFWCVSDNLRKGAATNAVQIGHLLSKQLSRASA